MKRLLKETIVVWIAIILVIVSIVTYIAVPVFIITHAGTGYLQDIVCVLWLTFWLSLVIAVAKDNDRKK